MNEPVAGRKMDAGISRVGVHEQPARSYEHSKKRKRDRERRTLGGRHHDRRCPARKSFLRVFP